MSEHAMIIADAVGRIVPLAIALLILFFGGCAAVEDYQQDREARQRRARNWK
jgi:hypothetical protein